MHMWSDEEELEVIQKQMQPIILKNWTQEKLVAIFLNYNDRYLGSLFYCKFAVETKPRRVTNNEHYPLLSSF